MPRTPEEIVERFHRRKEIKELSVACGRLESDNVQAMMEELNKLLDELPEIYSDVRSIMSQRVKALQQKPIVKAKIEIISTLITFYKDFERAYKALENLPQPVKESVCGGSISQGAAKPPVDLTLNSQNATVVKSMRVRLELSECVELLCKVLNEMSQEVQDEHWSLVELNLTEEDSLAFRCLPDFFDDLEDEMFEDENEDPILDMEDWGEFSANEFMGTWLMISEMLALRERENPNEYIQTLITMGWSQSRLQSLFWTMDKHLHAQDGPNALHKRLMEAAVNRLNLRSAIDTDLQNRWEKTFFLQFGLTKNQWIGELQNQNYDIAGEYAPSIARNLLMEDSIWHSPSFQKTWKVMQRYKKRTVGRNEAKELMTSSSWIANQWIDDLLNVQQA
jgi:hypothetical protein